MTQWRESKKKPGPARGENDYSHKKKKKSLMMCAYGTNDCTLANTKTGQTRHCLWF